MSDAIIDRIYESAFVPELWRSTIESIAGLVGAASATLLLLHDRSQPARYVTTPATEAMWRDYIAAGRWKHSQSAKFNFAPPSDALSGFIYAIDYMTAEQRAIDASTQTLHAANLGPQLGTVIPMPTGEIATFTFERRLTDGRHSPRDIAALNGLRPHLARASLMAARLGLERAHNAVAVMDTLGLPAAVVTTRGRVLAVNALLERLPQIFIPRAGGTLALPTLGADALLQTALEHISGDAGSNVHSIPLAANAEAPAMVIHVLPLRRGAYEMFAGGDALIVATEIGLQSGALPATVLMGLFDLTAAEARLAAHICNGDTLASAAAQQGIKVTTARSYLAQIFRKTGTGQQSQLVAMLRSARARPDARPH